MSERAPVTQLTSYIDTSFHVSVLSVLEVGPSVAPTCHIAHGGSLTVCVEPSMDTHIVRNLLIGRHTERPYRSEGYRFQIMGMACCHSVCGRGVAIHG